VVVVMESAGTGIIMAAAASGRGGMVEVVDGFSAQVICGW
jgi:hypothetical protein